MKLKIILKNTNGKIAIIGISSGKDSSVAAAMCVNALGKENVIGILMPNKQQSDINDSIRLCEHLMFILQKSIAQKLLVHKLMNILWGSRENLI